MRATRSQGNHEREPGVAATKNGTLLHPGTGTPITMVDGSNDKISVPTFETNEVIRVAYA